MADDDIVVLEGANHGDRLTLSSYDESHFFIFSRQGYTPGTMGEDIAKIDLRDGTVTYSAPDAGRDAARVFWGMFEDYIKEQIAKEKNGT